MASSTSPPPPIEHHSVTTSFGSPLVGHSPSSPPAPNERYRPEAVASVTNAEKYDRNGDRPACSCLSSPSGRNLVVCIDGTANQFSEKNTNVVELYSRLVKNKDQLTYYHSGIGTYVRDSKSWKSWFSVRARRQSLYHALDEAFAWNFKQRVLSAYQWLSENYEDGDRIFLFGFSRGAYQIRVIAGMIELVGLLYKGNNDQIPFAYELYAESISSEERDRPKTLSEHFKQTLSRPNVKVHFVGAWDTVSSVGIFRGRSLPETTTGMNHVCAFRHALALDELRVKFLPEYANGGAGPDSYAKHIKEVWFAGSHSDIGGGNMPNLERNLFGPALRWMSYEAISCGLKMQPHLGGWSPITPSDSMTLIWKIPEYIPLLISRLSYKNADSVERWSPHKQRPRQVQDGQLIHESVLEEMAKLYKPKARIYDKAIVWDKAALLNQMMIENDPYTQANDVFSRLSKLDWTTSEISDADVDVLSTLASSEIGRRSIIDAPQAPETLVASLDHECKRPAGNLGLQPRQSLRATIDALDAFRLSPPDVKKDVDNKLLIFESSLGTGSPQIREAVLELQRRLRGETLATMFDALMKKIEVLGKVGDEIAMKKKKKRNLFEYFGRQARLVSVVMENFKTQQNVDQQVRYLLTAMQDSLSFVDSARELANEPALQDIIERMTKQIVECCYFIREYSQHSLIKKVAIHSADIDDQIVAFCTAFTDLRKDFDSRLSLSYKAFLPDNDRT